MKAIIFILFFPIISFGQVFKVGITPTLNYLYKEKNEIVQITNTNNLKFIPIKFGSNKINLFKIIKGRNGLFILLDGTGQIYKASKLEDKFIYFDRIDSTKYFGNTFRSIDFSYKDTLMSMGGYGYWNNNCQLRKFNTKSGEWEVIKLNKPYNANTLSEYIDIRSSKIYYIVPALEDQEFVSNDQNDFKIIELDIANHVNRELGILNSNIYKIADLSYHISLPSLNGTLFSCNRNYYLLQFATNKVFKLINKSIYDTIQNQAGNRIDLTFEKDGLIYYNKYPDSTLRFIKITINDFKLEPYPIYLSTDSKTSYLKISIYSILILTIIFLLVILFKKKSENNKSIIVSERQPKDFQYNNFNQIEQDLVSALIEKSNKKSYLTIAEMNTILGLKNKPTQIQKTVRNETINRINHKFNLNLEITTSLIERIKSTDDKRNINYIIKEENIKLYLNKFIKNNK